MDASIRYCIAVAVLLGALVPPMSARTYYVSSTTGLDTNSGLDPHAAWRTVSRVNQAHLVPGDEVLFKRGELWRETLRPSCSGAAGKVITFGAFGTGPGPVISGSDPIAEEDWVRENGLQFLSGVQFAPAALWDADQRMVPVARKEELRNDSQWWYDSKQQRVYIRTPADAGREVEIQVRDFNIENHEQSHIVYEDLDLRHAIEGLRLYAWSAQVSDVTLKNSEISTEPSAPHRTMSAGVYASVHTGVLSEIHILNNRFVPYPRGLEHWGVYFVQGVDGFRIVGNEFSPAGEDAITIWHSAHGVISGNSGGGNGENTVDAKDSHDIVISGNYAEADGEYNIVVHGVDSDRMTYNIVVENNHCVRGGEAGQLTAGIVLLFTQDTQIRKNVIESAYGAGIFVNDRGIGYHNEISENLLRHNGTHQSTGAITLEDVSDTKVWYNTVDLQGSDGFAFRLEGGPHTREVRVSSNQLFPGNGNLVDIADNARRAFVADNNSYYGSHTVRFRLGRKEYSFFEWQGVSRQDAHSRVLPANDFLLEEVLAGTGLQEATSPQR